MVISSICSMWSVQNFQTYIIRNSRITHASSECKVSWQGPAHVLTNVSSTCAKTMVALLEHVVSARFVFGQPPQPVLRDQGIAWIWKMTLSCVQPMGKLTYFLVEKAKVSVKKAFDMLAEFDMLWTTKIAVTCWQSGRAVCPVTVNWPNNDKGDKFGLGRIFFSTFMPMLNNAPILLREFQGPVSWSSRS